MSELDQEKLQLYKQLQPAILRLHKGDVLVVRHGGVLSEDAMNRMKALLKGVLRYAGHDPEETPVVVLSEGVELQVLRKEKGESS